MKTPITLSITAILVALAPVALAQPEEKHQVEAIMLTHTIALDSGGRLHASAGLYAKVHADKDGSYYAAGRFGGSGVLAGALAPQVDGMRDEAVMLANGQAGGRGVAIYPPRVLKYLLVKPDGVTLCGTDAQYYPMACTQTDALRTTRPRAAPAAPPSNP